MVWWCGCGGVACGVVCGVWCGVWCGGVVCGGAGWQAGWLAVSFSCLSRSVLRRSPLAVCSSPFALRRLLFAVCSSPFALRRLLFAAVRCAVAYATRSWRSDDDTQVVFLYVCRETSRLAVVCLEERSTMMHGSSFFVCLFVCLWVSVLLSWTFVPTIPTRSNNADSGCHDEAHSSTADTVVSGGVVTMTEPLKVLRQDCVARARSEQCSVIVTSRALQNARWTSNAAWRLKVSTIACHLQF